MLYIYIYIVAGLVSSSQLLCTQGNPYCIDNNMNTGPVYHVYEIAECVFSNRVVYICLFSVVYIKI